MAWLPGYLYRKSIPLTGGSDGAFTYFQLKLAIAYVTDHMQSDFDDLRFTKEDGETLIDAWLEDKTDSTSADVWVEFPSTPANGVEQTYYMYYGKVDAVSDWDIGATAFKLGDDFPGSSLDTGKWNVQGTVDVSNSEASLDADDAIYSIDTFGYNCAVKAKAKADEQDTQFVSFRDGFGVLPTNGIILYNSDYDYPDDFDRYDCNSSNGGSGNDNYVDNQLDFRNVYRTYEITRIDGEAKYYQDENLMATRTSYLPTGDIGVGAVVWDSSQASTLVLDWIFVRKYTTNPPTYEFGSEENAPSGLSMAVAMHHLMQMRRS